MLVAAALTVAVALGSVATPAGAQKKQPQLRILVTNDDGYAAEGIDALVEALRKLPNTKVTVVAPAENQSGKGGTVTPGGAVTATEVTTLSGYPATSVVGTPADSATYALANVTTGKKRPNLVISGINQGQNLGATIEASGTVGAARVAANGGIPALAVSQGFPREAPDYPASVREAIKWVKAFRKALAKDSTPKVTVENLNVPTCATGEVRGLIEVPPAPTNDGTVEATQDCTSTLEDPTNDAEAFNNGFATISELSF
jgi:5'-nucleotidase